MACNDISALKTIAAAISAAPINVFVGAGISIAAPTCAPDWNSLSRILLRAIVRRIPDNVWPEDSLKPVFDRFTQNPPRPELLMEVIRQNSTLQEQAFTQLIGCLGSLQPNSNHLFLARLAKAGRLNAIITTNFDTCIETALAEAGASFRCFASDDELAELAYVLDKQSPPKVLPVIKIHGSVGDARSIVMTLRDSARPLHGPKAHCLPRLLKNKVLLVHGYSGRDDDIRPVLLGDAASFSHVYWAFFAPTDHWPALDGALKHLSNVATCIDLNRADLFSAMSDLVALPKLSAPSQVAESLPRGRDWLEQHMQYWTLQLSADDAAVIAIEFLRLSGQYDDAFAMGKQYLADLTERYKKTPEPRQLVRLIGLNNQIGRALLDRGNHSGSKEDFHEAYNFIDWAFTIGDQIFDYGPTWSEEILVLSRDDHGGRLAELKNRAGPEYALSYDYMCELFTVVQDKSQGRIFGSTAVQALLKFGPYTRHAGDAPLLGMYVYSRLPGALRRYGQLELADGNLSNAMDLLRDSLALAYAHGDVIEELETMITFSRACLSKSSRWSTTGRANAHIAACAKARAIELCASFGHTLQMRRIEGLPIQPVHPDGSEIARELRELALGRHSSPTIAHVVQAISMEIASAQLSGRLRQSVELMSLLHRIWVTTGQEQEATSVVHAIADKHRDFKDHFSVWWTYRDILETGVHNDDYITALRVVGSALIETKNPDYAMEGKRMFTRALALQTKISGEDDPGVLFAQGQAAMESSEYVAAIQAFERAIASAKNHKFRLGYEARCCHSIGLCHHRAGNYPDGFVWYQKALEIERRHTGILMVQTFGLDPILLTHTISSLGELLIKWDKPREAVRWITEGAMRYAAQDMGQMLGKMMWRLREIEEVIGEAAVLAEAQAIHRELGVEIPTQAFWR